METLAKVLLAAAAVLGLIGARILIAPRLALVKLGGLHVTPRRMGFTIRVR